MLLNFYPFVMKYINPAQQEVTKVLAALCEAVHSKIPPEELRPVVLHVMHTFVTETQASEVIEVGLNTIREICARGINILTEEELTDLVEFRKFKHKGVSLAARGLVNLYRELHPAMLHRSLRGREATMALSRGELHAPIYGAQQAAEGIDGIDMLLGKSNNASKTEGNELITEKVLSAEDFKKLRKMRLQRSIERQLGGKRNRREAGFFSDDSEDENSAGSDSESSDGDTGLAGRMPDMVSADSLKRGVKSRKSNKRERLEHVKEGRTDFKEQMLEKRKSRKGGKTNIEQKRNKPVMMALKSKQANSKKGLNSKQKLGLMKKHIKTLKKKAGGKMLRRR